MSTSYSTADMIRGLREQIKAVNTESGELARLQRGIEGDVAKIDVELEQAWTQLAETLIPAWEPAVFNRASVLLRLPPIAAAPVERRLEEHLLKARTTLQQLSNDPLVADRENQRNEAQIRLAELDEAIAPLQGSTTALEAEPYFEELLAYRYGTESYGVKFFQLLYYTHWKNADLIVEKYGPRLKAADFGALAVKYIEEKTALTSLFDAKKVQTDKLADIEAHSRRLAEIEQSILQAVPRALALVRARVREHLQPLPNADVAALLASVPDVDLAWRRVVGLMKKKEYLTDLVREQVKASLADLGRMRSKLDRETNKLSRPKNAHRPWTAVDWNRRFGNDRAAKWQKRRERVQHTRHEIVTFHDYGRWNPTSDLLWWDVMSDGRLDGNFIHEVRSRPHQHVHQQQRDVDDRDAFADVS